MGGMRAWRDESLALWDDAAWEEKDAIYAAERLRVAIKTDALRTPVNNALIHLRRDGDPAALDRLTRFMWACGASMIMDSPMENVDTFESFVNKLVPRDYKEVILIRRRDDVDAADYAVIGANPGYVRLWLEEDFIREFLSVNGVR